MSWGDELKIIRRFLRDPTGAIWSESFLRHLYNDVQQDYQHKTAVLEDIVAQKVPGTFQFAYMFEWEWRHLPAEQSQFHQCLSEHDDGVCCHRWEPQQVAGIAADVADYGVHFSQPWEAFMGETPGELIKMSFPKNFNTMKFIAYDQEPIFPMSLKQVQSTDASYVTQEGDPVGYYPYDETHNCYVLYPRPSVSFVNEIAGEGMALFAEGDTEDVTTGMVAVRTGSTDVSAETGLPIDIVDTVNSVFMVYHVAPADVSNETDVPEFPAFLRKYIRYGVIGRAYGANTDGRIRSLGDYWEMRYGMGVQFGKKFARARKQDRDYRFTTKGAVSRRHYRHPRLPDGYPAVSP